MTSIIHRLDIMKMVLPQQKECMYHYTEAEAATGIFWRDRDGVNITELSMDVKDEEVVVPVVEPSYCGKQVRYEVEGTAVSLDRKAGIVTAKEQGVAIIRAYNEQNQLLSSLTVSVADHANMTGIAGKNYTGLYNHNGTWWYLKNGYREKVCWSCT